MVLPERKTENKVKKKKCSQRKKELINLNTATVNLNVLENLRQKKIKDVILIIKRDKDKFYDFSKKNMNLEEIVNFVILTGTLLESKHTDKSVTEFLINDTFVTNLENFMITFFNQPVDKYNVLCPWKQSKVLVINVLKICEVPRCLKTRRNSLRTIATTFATFIPILENAHRQHMSIEIKNKLQKVLDTLFSEENLEPNTGIGFDYDDNDFRQISFCPSTSQTLEKICEETSIISSTKGLYKNVEHYLNQQTLLLRQDSLMLLLTKIDICRSPKKLLEPSISLYKPVHFLQIEAFNDNYCVRILVNSSKYNQLYGFKESRKLKYESLVGFTKDNFETIFFGKICDRNLENIRKGEVIVEFEEYVCIDFSSPYTMVDFKICFQPFVRILEEIDPSNFPMEKYIIKEQFDSKKPQYMNGINTITIEGQKLSLLEDWSCKKLYNFNESQLVAFKEALIKEFTIIYGPPATGKTYVGVRVVQSLIYNKHLWYKNTPLLVVCRTNQALDAFLGELLVFTNNIVRIGGHSNKEALKIKNLNDKSELKKNLKLDEVVLDIQFIFEKLEEIDSYETILHFDELSNSSSCTWFCDADSDKMLKWLLVEMDDETFRILKTLDRKDGFLLSLESLYDEIERLEYLLQQSKQSASNTVQQSKTEINKRFQEAKAICDYLSRRLALGKQCQDKIIKPNSADLSDFENLTPDERWNLYFYWVQSYRKELLDDLVSHKLEYQDLEEIYNEELAKEIKNSLVVGITMTKAVHIRSLLLALKSPIVMVEEAARIPEAHLITCLTDYCQQLILIGDHRQSKPKAKDLNSSRISIFERIIKCNFSHCQVLNVQYRLRPEVSSLLSTLYPFLQDHPSVIERPPIKGILNNLFFINHNSLQETNQIHQQEIDFFIHLAKYLIINDYNSENITILTVDLAHMIGFQREVLKYGELEGVKILFVGNCHGEMYNIVLLSLSGYCVSMDSKICDVLTKTVNGIYMRGNMEQLCSGSELWCHINKTLEKLTCIGSKLPLKPSKCSHNPTVHVKSEADLIAVVKQSCKKKCKKKLRCGHACVRLCHFPNESHADYKCEKMCKRPICDQNHKICQKKCHEKCDPCTFQTEGIFPCGHAVQIKCYQRRNFKKIFYCKTVVPVKLPCSHTVEIPCSTEIKWLQCPFPCGKELACGHHCDLKCHAEKDPHHLKYQCRKRCTKYNRYCTTEKEEHKCKKLCFEICNECTVPVKKQRMCTHIHEVPCYFNVNDVNCSVPCTQTLKCGHQCKKLCYEICGDCDVKVSKKYPVCEHPVKLRCSQKPDRKFCQKKCPLKLVCGHLCNAKCNKPCTDQCSVLVDCSVGGECGHTITKIRCSTLQNSAYMQENSRLPLKFCNKACEALLKCGHRCSGTCGKCYQGRFHVRCEKKCTSILVCGHQYEYACKQTFAPCTLKCLQKCQHNSCSKKCCEICATCKKKCPRSCIHQKCSKICGEMCDVPPCEEPCEKVQICGHSCIGFCGDPCPPKCFSCNPQLFDETSTVKEQRYIFLNDCKHIIENSKMENWLQRNENQLGFPLCPICNTIIMTTHRYSHLVKQAIKDHSLIKNRMYGTAKENEDYRLELHRKFFVLTQDSEICNSAFPKIKSVLEGLESQLIQWTRNKRKQIYKYQLETLNSKLEIIKTILYRCNTLTVHKYLLSQTNFILSLLKCEHDYFTKEESENISSEIHRFLRTVEFCQISSTVPEGSLNNVEVENIQKRIITHITSLKQFAEKEDCNVKKMLDELRSLVSPNTKIFTMTGFQKDCWFKCSSGHVHATDAECSFFSFIDSKCYD